MPVLVMCTAVLGSKLGAHELQGAVSPISTVFRAVTEDVTLYMEGVSVLTVFLHINSTKQVTQSQWILSWSLGHRQLRSVVTWSAAVYQCDHMVTDSFLLDHIL